MPKLVKVACSHSCLVDSCVRCPFYGGWNGMYCPHTKFGRSIKEDRPMPTMPGGLVGHESAVQCQECANCQHEAVCSFKEDYGGAVTALKECDVPYNGHKDWAKHSKLIKVDVKCVHYIAKSAYNMR